MSEIYNWEDLPKDITPDFVSIPEDYDFPFYLSEKEEWINYKYLEKKKGKVSVSEPCLITELNRFVPYLENGGIKFHPLNMPYIKIGKIEIVGFVLGTSQDARFHEYQVEDGTGTIKIFYEKRKFDMDSYKRCIIDKKYCKHARNIDMNGLQTQICPSKFPNPRPNFYYPPDTSISTMAIIEHNWALETNNGLLGKKIVPHDYIHAVGYCSLDFLDRKKSRKEITFEDLSIAKLNFYATAVTCIDESEYNTKLISWLGTVVKRRYDTPEKSSSAS